MASTPPRSRTTVRAPSASRVDATAEDQLDLTTKGRGGGADEKVKVPPHLRKQRQQVTGYELDIRGDRRQEHPKSFIRIEIVHRFTGRDLDPDAIAHAIDLSHTKYCSVQASLDPAIEVTNRFEIVPEGSLSRASE